MLKPKFIFLAASLQLMMLSPNTLLASVAPLPSILDLNGSEEIDSSTPDDMGVFPLNDPSKPVIEADGLSTSDDQVDSSDSSSTIDTVLNPNMPFTVPPGYFPSGAPLTGISSLEIHVSIPAQRLYLIVDGVEIAAWNVATGRPGYPTPIVTYRRPIKLELNHWSKKWHAPMPFSIFFTSGAAIHVGSIHKRSHGCVHLDSVHAAQLYHYVQRFRSVTHISILN